MSTNPKRVSFDMSHHTMPQTPMMAGSLVLTEEESDLVDEGAFGNVQVLPSIWWAFFVLGSAMLLGFNVMINSIPYFLLRVQGSSIESTLGFYLTTVLTLTNFLAFLYATLTSTRIGIPRRIVVAILATSLLNFLLQLSTFVTVPAGVLFAFVLVVAIALSCAAGSLQTGGMALASLFGSDAVQGVISGQAAIGVVVSIAKLFSTIANLDAGPESELADADDRSSALFFGLSTLFSVGSFAAYWHISRTKEYKQIMDSARTSTSSVDADDETRPLIQQAPPSPESLSPNPDESNVESISPLKMLILNKYLNFTVTFVFVITLSVFPPITTSILSVDKDRASIWSIPAVFQAAHFVIFNVADLIGRLLPSHPPILLRSPKALVALSLSRFAFIPLFLLCNISTRAKNTPPVFNSDAIFFLLVLLLGLTNGYTNCSAIVCASSLKLNPLLQGKSGYIDTAAIVASFSLSSGLLIGSLASFAVEAVVCRCNPFSG